MKPADKGSATIIKDKAQYIAEGNRQLSNTQFCEPIEINLTGEVMHRINIQACDMSQRGKISQKPVAV